MLINRSAWPEVSLLTGIPVTLETTAAISSAVTDSWMRLPSEVLAVDSPSFGSFSSNEGIIEYLNSLARPKLFSRYDMLAQEANITEDQGVVENCAFNRSYLCLIELYPSLF